MESKIRFAQHFHTICVALARGANVCSNLLVSDLFIQTNTSTPAITTFFHFVEFKKLSKAREVGYKTWKPLPFLTFIPMRQQTRRWAIIIKITHHNKPSQCNPTWTKRCTSLFPPIINFFYKYLWSDNPFNHTSATPQWTWQKAPQIPSPMTRS